MDLRSTSGALYLGQENKQKELFSLSFRLSRPAAHSVPLNSPSSGDIVGVRGSGSDFSGESKVGDLHQLRAHAQQILWFHVPMEKA